MKHKTKEGKIMLIEQMDDNHLRNTINMIITKLEEMKQLQSLNSFELKMRGINCNIYDLENNMNILIEKLPNYVFEASLRNLDLTDFRNRYNELTGRNKEQNKLLLDIISGRFQENKSIEDKRIADDYDDYTEFDDDDDEYQ